LIINVSKIEKNEDIVNLYLSTMGVEKKRDDVDIYLNNSILSKDNWRFYQNNLIIDIDKYSSTDEYEVYISK
jgi:uncharacterized protein YneR